MCECACGVCDCLIQRNSWPDHQCQVSCVRSQLSKEEYLHIFASHAPLLFVYIIQLSMCFHMNETFWQGQGDTDVSRTASGLFGSYRTTGSELQK